MKKKYTIINDKNLILNENSNKNPNYIFIIIITVIIVFYLVYNFVNSNNENFENLENNSRAFYINSNYDKINDSSFGNEIELIYDDIEKSNLPTTDIRFHKLISNPNEFNNLINLTSSYKNIYKPGELVISNSAQNIDKNKICYRQNGILLDTDTNFINKYPDCMVCSTVSSENQENLEKSKTWINTKTNIENVCLFNLNSRPNSDVPNLGDCKKFCNVK